MKVGEIYVDIHTATSWLILEVKDRYCTKCRCVQASRHFKLGQIQTNEGGWTFNGCPILNEKEAASLKLELL